MWTHETEYKLAFFLTRVSDFESSIEKSREELCKVSIFDLNSIFNVLDTRSNESLDIADLKLFLSKSGISSTRQALHLFIKQYDSNNDGRLSIDDFQKFVLPAENPELIKIVLSRKVFSVTPSIEDLFAKHLALEISFQNKLEKLRQKLNDRVDFNPIDAFRAIDVRRLNFFTAYEVRDFLRKNGFKVSLGDVEGIIRRLDRDEDGKINFEEFNFYLVPWKIETRYSSPVSNRKNSSRTNKRNAKSPYQSTKNSPSKSSLKTSPLQKKLNRSQGSYLFESLSQEEIDSVSEFLFNQIKINRDIEQEKNNLVKCTDFNLLDFFRLFDQNDKGYITPNDIEMLVNSLRIACDIDEIYLLVKHFSSNRDSTIRYFDFERMYYPKDIYLSNLLKEKFGGEWPALDRLRTFSYRTTDQIIKVLKLQLHSESIGERLRREIFRKKSLNFYEIFQHIDKDRDGGISIIDFADFFQRLGINISREDLEGLMDKYDKNLDGRVSFNEFIEEITPKIF